MSPRLAFNRTIVQTEAKALKDQIESASATPSEPPQANGSAPDESVAVAAAAAAAQAAAEEEAKSLKEELRSVRDALEASEESRKSVENLLAETKQVRGRVRGPRLDGDSLPLLLLLLLLQLVVVVTGQSGGGSRVWKGRQDACCLVDFGLAAAELTRTRDSRARAEHRFVFFSNTGPGPAYFAAVVASGVPLHVPRRDHRTPPQTAFSFAV